MSQGTTTLDRRYYISNSYSSFLIGSYYRKSWSGGDRVVGESFDKPHPYQMVLDNKVIGSIVYMDQKWALSVPPRPEFNWDANDEIALLGKLAEKYRAHNWNAGVFVGELGKTVDMLASRVKQFGRAAMAVKKGRLLEAYQLLRVKPEYGHTRQFKTIYKTDPSRWFEIWLELRYGWRPLLADIYKLSEAIATRDVPRKVRIRVRKKHVLPIPLVTLAETEGSGFYAQQIIATLEEVQPSIPERLGLVNPAAVVWELIPLSFVVDWFAPIGNYIETRNTVSKMKGSYVRTVYEGYRARYSGISAYGASSGYSNPTGFAQEIRVTRTIAESLSVPLPVWKNPLATSGPRMRLLDALALVTAVFSKKEDRRSSSYYE